MKTNHKEDVIVLGNGPAGSLLMLYLIIFTNLSILNISKTDTNRQTSWSGTYGVWTDELRIPWLLQALQLKDFSSLFEKTWTKVCTIGHDGRAEPINREYGIVAQAVFRNALCRACKSSRVRFVKGEAQKITRAAEKSVVKYTDVFGTTKYVDAPVVVDATGCQREEISRRRKLRGWSSCSLKRRYQAFYGEFLHFPEGHGLPVHSAVLMDWSLEFRDELPLPSFVYVLPFNENCVLVEETVLLSDAPVRLQQLKKRLEVRKAKLFRSSSEYSIYKSEKHNLPMGGQLLPAEPGLIYFGGRNNMGHAATGYMFGFVLTKIPTLADCIKKANGSPITIGDRVIRRLNDMGAHVLSTTSSRERLSQFMQASFRTPFWYEFMTRKASPCLYILNMCMFAFHLRNPRHLFWLFQHVTAYIISSSSKYVQGMVSFWPYPLMSEHQKSPTIVTSH